MNRWEPHIDLARLLEALGQEVAAATEQEVRQVCVEDGGSIRTAAREVRELIGALISDPGDPDAGPLPAEAVKSREHHQRQH